ncbi:hypothetical protein E3V33_01485 [Candidatus Marinimicrobia bacterium MT.SAG.4]|nr:hypothetical protein E3V33_01485 [Candidatus Marinimicrobia bacterium MT.SAG.4]
MSHIGKLLPFLFLIVATAITYAQVPEQDNRCLDCHSNSTQLAALTEQSERFHIPSDFKEQSVHNEINCTGCHADPGGYPHPEVVGLIQCGSCHENESTEYLSGPHGNPLAVSLDLAPKCGDCHNVHLIRRSSNVLSNVHVKNEAKTCTQCHGNEDQKNNILNITNRVDYDMPNRAIKKGIHFLDLKISDNSNPLTCSRCHGVHALSEKIGKNWQSNYSIEADFCGECHTSETISFKRNLHFTQEISSLSGNISLTCTDCHQEHLISNDKYQYNEEKSAGQMTGKCIECHQSVRISRTFAQNVRGNSPTVDSYHGATNIGGDLFFSDCSSCHGIHELNSYTGKDKESVKFSIIAQCGSCHPNAAANFVSSPVHMAQGELLDSEESIARYFFLALIVTMISLIVLSIIGDFYKLYLRKKN